MQSNAVLAVVLAATLAAATPLAAQQSDSRTGDDPVVARVDGHQIYRSEVIATYSRLPDQYRQVPIAVLFPRIVEQLVNRQILAEEGRKLGLDDDPEILEQVAEFTRAAIQNAYIDRAIARAVTEEKVRETYEGTVAGAQGPEQVRASHILVDSQAEGEAIIEELAGGADFAELARSKSTGPSGAQGGDLGYFTREEMVEPFSSAAFALPVGEVGPDPVETRFGWHVIMVVDRRRAPPPTFEEARPRIEEQLTQEFVAAHMAELRSKADIEVFDVDGSPTGGQPAN